MCICCASGEVAFEKMHMMEPRTERIKPHLDLAVGPVAFVLHTIEDSIFCGLIFGCG